MLRWDYCSGENFLNIIEALIWHNIERAKTSARHALRSTSFRRPVTIWEMHGGSTSFAPGGSGKQSGFCAKDYSTVRMICGIICKTNTEL